MSWHWDEKAGRRVPTNRRAYLASRVPERAVLVVAGLALWSWGVVELVTGAEVGGGALVFGGGLLLIIAAGGGWRRFRSAFLEWLGGWW